MNRDKQIYKKINDAVKILCEVYDILNSNEEINNNDDKNINKFLAISEFTKKYPEFTQGKLRHFIHQNTNNFKEKCISRVGTKIYIREDAFFDWINE